MLQKDTYYLATPLEDPQPFQVAAKLADIADGHPPGHPQHSHTARRWDHILLGIRAFQWNSPEDDMANISAHWPDTLFTITCNGEHPDDMWRIYALNGNSQLVKAQLIYPEPDAKLMTPPAPSP